MLKKPYHFEEVPNFILPTIRTAIEDWQLQSGFTCAFAIFTWNFQIILSVGMCWKLDRECHVDFCMFLTPHELNFELLMKTL